MDESINEDVQKLVADAAADNNGNQEQQSIEMREGEFAGAENNQEPDTLNGTPAAGNAQVNENGYQNFGGKVYPYDDLSANDYSTDENYQKIVQYGITPVVAAELIEAVKSGIFQSDVIEERTLEFMKNITAEHGRYVLCQFRKSNIMGIVNPSAYLGSLVKNFKERVKVMGAEVALSLPVVYSPPKENLEALLQSKGYPLEVTIGQRKYGGPPPNFDGTMPGSGSELYVGKIPKEVYEDELVPLFEKCGTLYDFRLMMDPLSGTSKGYGFATFMNKKDATAAASKYDGYEIKPGKKIRCNVSIANTRLFVGNIPKSKGKEDVLEEFTHTAELEGLIDAIVYPSPEDPVRRKNRGFCFLEFSEHRHASSAKRRLSSGRVRPFNCDVYVDWAEPQEEVDEEAMAQVKSLYVKTLNDSHTEDMIKEAFEKFGELEKVKKIKEYCFVHYTNRDDALKAIEEMNGKDFHGVKLDVSLARPHVERKKLPMTYRGGGGYRGAGAYMGGRGGPQGVYPSSGMYGGGPVMVDPYQQAAASFGGGGGFDYSGYGYAGGYGYGGGAGLEYGAGGGYGFGARGGMGFSGAPAARGHPGGGYRGPAPAMYGQPYGAGGMPRGGATGGMRGGGYGRGGFGMGYRGMGGPGSGGFGKGGIPVKRPFSGGGAGFDNSAKRKNDG